MSTPWCNLVFLLQAAQDGDGRLHRRLVHQHFLEAALERGILLDVLAVFVERGRADAVQLAARQRRLQHVAGIDRALGLAGAHHGVQLVDEDDGLAGVLGNFLQHRLQPLLEFTAVLGAGEQQRHVERQHALALERFRHFAVDDALGEPLHDGGLAHARLADQHRVVLGAPLQDLDHAPDLVVAPDHRVELAGAGALGEVERVFLQRLAAAFGFGILHAFAAAHRVDRLLQRLAAYAVLLQELAGLALVVGGRQQEQLGCNVLIAALLGFLVGEVQKIGELARDVDLTARAFHLGQAIDRALQRRAQTTDVGAGARQAAMPRRRSSWLISAASRCWGSMYGLSLPTARLWASAKAC